MLITMHYNALAINPQLCLKSDEELLKDTNLMSNYILEQKYDGTRILPHFNNDGVKLFTRNGKSELSEHYYKITKSLESLNIPYGTILDGELVFINEHGDIEFQSALITSNTAKERKLIPHLMVFDIVQLGARDLKQIPLFERKKILEEIFSPETHAYVYMSLSKVHDNPDEYYRLFMNEVENGREGVVVKLKDSLYEEGARNKSWMKFKRHDTMDCVLMGITEGTGKYADTFGALILGSVSGGKVRVCGYCSGMTDSERAEIYGKVMSLPEYKYNKKFAKDIVRTIAPTITVEVEYMEITEYNMLRHPRFVRFRYDKTLDVDIEESEKICQMELDAFLS